MTRKDFIVIANGFRERRLFLRNNNVNNWGVRRAEFDQTVETMIVALDCAYPNFDPAKFRLAIYGD